MSARSWALGGRRAQKRPTVFISEDDGLAQRLRYIVTPTMEAHLRRKVEAEMDALPSDGRAYIYAEMQMGLAVSIAAGDGQFDLDADDGSALEVDVPWMFRRYGTEAHRQMWALLVALQGRDEKRARVARRELCESVVKTRLLWYMTKAAGKPWLLRS